MTLSHEKTLIEHAAELDHVLNKLPQTEQVDKLRGEVKAAIIYASNGQPNKALRVMFEIVAGVKELFDKTHS